ncbi:hypothetical protein NE237_013455 [Protea cynaroides]|uniref:Uncharacterized protein n=1 Tax=Protea cynaroides TaxID=273540 RepID=A0A9Q0JZ07_9MAGN|nr:hypothetical protein NE237_013455 [Protea cynaroides]
MAWFGTILLACSRMQFKLSEVHGSVRIDRMHMSCTLAHGLTSSLLFLALGKIKVGSITSTLLSTYLVSVFIVYVDFMLIGHVLNVTVRNGTRTFLQICVCIDQRAKPIIELLRESRPEYYIDSIQRALKNKRGGRSCLVQLEHNTACVLHM